MDENTNDTNRLTQAKEAWAREKRGLGGREVDDDAPDAARLPPGQHLVNTWPVLDLGRKPDIPLADWRLTISGLVAHPTVWTWEQFLAQPQCVQTSDFHCVTTWSTFDNRWEGLRFLDMMAAVVPLPAARYVFFTAYDDYTTNLPLTACTDDDVLLCRAWNGQPLTTAHGGPLRMIVPKRYAWKGAKWIKEIRFSEQDEKGFWEMRGYSNSAFPWQDDRYG
ncbi:MAG: molybdopterin-dependent oxidoreductase [Nitrospiraceae bacterium]